MAKTPRDTTNASDSTGAAPRKPYKRKVTKTEDVTSVAREKPSRASRKASIDSQASTETAKQTTKPAKKRPSKIAERVSKKALGESVVEPRQASSETLMQPKRAAKRVKASEGNEVKKVRAKPKLIAVDPNAALEAQKYENPIHSREALLALLAEVAEPLNANQIARLIEIDSHDQLDALHRRLRAMERDGQLMVNRKGAYGIVERMHLLKCRVIGHRDGYGFAKPIDDPDHEDLFLSARQMDKVFDGDEVLAMITGMDRRGRAEGKIVEILKRKRQRIVGRYESESGFGLVVPEHARITHQIIIPPGCDGGAKHGQVVSAEVTDFPERGRPPKGRVVEVLGDHLDPGLEIEVAIRSHDIPHEWPEEVIDEAGRLEAEPLEEDKAHRVDLRDLPFVTIDGEDARDFDDAVYCASRRGGGFTLWVAIADVSHYVKPGAPLDEEAVVRGNSVYFPERVVPMLPEALSNGLCSLKPHVDRLAMVCEMAITRAGSISSFEFYEAIIHSHARLTYTAVGEVLANGESDSVPRERYKDIARLHRLYGVLRKAREERKAIDFETIETRILFDENRKIAAIVPVVRNDAHKIIEECMLAANVATASLFEKHQVPMLFRVHEGPSGERLANLRQFLDEMFLQLGGGEKPKPEHYHDLLERVKDRDDASIIQTMMLRSLSQAVYKPDNAGHFGLNYEAYLHFTSPIRRYPDLLVHRGIRHLLRNSDKAEHLRRTQGAPKIPTQAIFPYDLKAMVGMGEHCSMTERRADDATRDVQLWLKCEYLREHVGDVYSGVIASVTGFGLFVELRDLYIEGLVHISSLPGDYYRYEAAHQQLVGERSGKTFRLGGKVTVQIARVDLDDKRIDLELLKTNIPDAPGHARKARKTAARFDAPTKRKARGSRGPKGPGGKKVAKGRRGK
jgi:ribonuclease R